MMVSINSGAISMAEQPYLQFQNLMGLSGLDKSIANQYLFIEQQSQLLEQIKDEIMKRKVPNQNIHLLQVPSMELSCPSVISSKMLSQDGSTSGGNKSKFAEEFQQSLVQSALEEVKRLCPQEIYETLKKTIENCRKVIDFQILQKNLEKARKEIDQLTHSNHILFKEKTNLLWQLNLLKPKVQNLQQEKLRVKKQIDQLSKKQAIISQIQTSFALKQKLNVQNRRKFLRQKQTVTQVKSSLDDTVKQFWTIFNKISDKCQSVVCPQNCWKKQVMKKCKQKLLQQRQALKQGQECLQKQEQMIQKMSQQFMSLLSNTQLLIKKSFSQKNVQSVSN